MYSSHVANYTTPKVPKRDLLRLVLASFRSIQTEERAQQSDDVDTEERTTMRDAKRVTTKKLFLLQNNKVIQKLHKT